MSTTMIDGRAAVTEAEQVRQAARAVRRARAVAAIEELTAARVALPIPSDDAAHVESWAREVQFALLSARLSGWWRVLGWLSYELGLDSVYTLAVYTARSAEQRRARDAGDRAQFWAARVEAAAQPAAGEVSPAIEWTDTDPR